jgi:phytoene synthase
MDFYRHCEDQVRASDKDRFLATLFAPAAPRGLLFALYAFNLEIAGVRDRVREPMAGEIRLQWWRDVLNGERASEAAANPVAAALLETIAHCALPAEPLRDLIEAHAFDLYDDPMPTRAALDAYAHKTAGVVFDQAARICGGVTRAVEEAAEHAGKAHAITDLLRRFARAASRHQVFVPAELLERHGTRVEEVTAGQASEGLRAALAALRTDARRNLVGFELLLPVLPAATMPAFLPLALVPGYLTRMVRDDYDPFHTPIEVAQWRRQWTLWCAARRYAGVMRGA